MADYQKMYVLLFNRVTNALYELEKANYGNAANILKEAQRETEGIYISADEMGKAELEGGMM